MKKVKLDTRIENAFNAFFETDERFENSQIVLNDTSALLQDPPKKTLAEKTDSIVNIVKYIFLFLPGSFLMFKLAVSIIYLSSQIPMPPGDLLLMTIWTLVISFVIYVGVGGMRETRNLVVPGSILSLSLILGGLFFLFPEPLRGQIVLYYSIYLFPLTLVIAGLAKHWVNKNEKSEN